jgi:hypothetical protein
MSVPSFQQLMLPALQSSENAGISEDSTVRWAIPWATAPERMRAARAHRRRHPGVKSLLAGSREPLPIRPCSGLGRCEELPSVAITRLRASGEVNSGTTLIRVKLGCLEASVRVHLRLFPNGGSWSFFGCPTCGKKVRVLRLYGDAVLCWSCCRRRGIRNSSETMSREQRARASIFRIRAKLAGEGLRASRARCWSKLDKRKQLEAALARAEYVAAHGRR